MTFYNVGKDGVAVGRKPGCARVVNKSRFPTAYLKALVDLVVTELDPPVKGYTVTVGDHPVSFSGRGWLCGQRVSMHRHMGRERGYWPHKTRDGRYKGSRLQEFRDRTEILVWLIGHEAAHAVYQGMEASHASMPLPRHGRDTEFLCDDKGMRCVELYRAHKAELWPRIRKAVRREHNLALQRERTEKERREIRRHPGHKLSVASGHLREWEGRLRYARNKVRAYAKRVKYYEKRLAATQAAPTSTDEIVDHGLD